MNGALFGPLVNDGEWWRIVTAGFLHANPLHLILNMVVLWFLGQAIEPVFGHVQVRRDLPRVAARRVVRRAPALARRVHRRRLGRGLRADGRAGDGLPRPRDPDHAVADLRPARHQPDLHALLSRRLDRRPPRRDGRRRARRAARARGRPAPLAGARARGCAAIAAGRGRRRASSPPAPPASTSAEQLRVQRLDRRRAAAPARTARATSAAAAAPSRSARSRVDGRASAAASAPASPGGTSTPVSPSRMISVRPPCAAATTQQPAARRLERGVGQRVGMGGGHDDDVGRAEHRPDVVAEAEEPHPVRDAEPPRQLAQLALAALLARPRRAARSVRPCPSSARARRPRGSARPGPSTPTCGPSTATTRASAGSSSSAARRVARRPLVAHGQPVVEHAHRPVARNCAAVAAETHGSASAVTSSRRYAGHQRSKPA